MTFKEMDISETETGYTTMSGKAVSEGDGIEADLKLQGGPVSSLTFEFASLLLQDSTKTAITVNGKKYDIDLDQIDVERMQ